MDFKKIAAGVICLLSLSGWGQVILVDSYATSNADGTTVAVHKDNAKRSGQTFTVTNAIIVDSVKLNLFKAGSPTGNTFVNLYNLTGTYGSTAVPTGDSLGLTVTKDISTISTSYTDYTFSFSSRILLQPNYYGLTICYFGGNVSNYLGINRDGSSPAHSGNVISFTTSWLAGSTRDAAFYVYGKGLIKKIAGTARNDTNKKIMGVAENSIKKVNTLTF